MRTYSMCDVAPTVSQVLGLPAPAASKGTTISEMAADLAGRRGVALLVPDALGLFAWKQWQAEMPYLGSLHRDRSIILRSVMPSITPVNFATMVTGTDREGHGIGAKEDEFACETLFDVIRDAGKLSAGIGFPDYTGSTLIARHADIDGTTDPGTDDSIADMVIRIAETQAPALLIAQLGRVDDVFHRFGPSSPEVIPMLRDTDTRLHRLVGRLEPLGYGVAILSDHGQHDVIDDPTTTLKGAHGEDRDEDRLVPCTWR